MSERFVERWKEKETSILIWPTKRRMSDLMDQKLRMTFDCLKWNQQLWLKNKYAKVQDYLLFRAVIDLRFDYLYAREKEREWAIGKYCCWDLRVESFRYICNLQLEIQFGQISGILKRAPILWPKKSTCFSILKGLCLISVYPYDILRYF